MVHGRIAYEAILTSARPRSVVDLATPEMVAVRAEILGHVEVGAATA
jgi:hypothetical protein